MAMSDPDGEPTVTLASPAGARTLVTAQRVGTRHDGPEAVVLELYDAHQRELHTFVRSLERDPATVEDLVAETFLRLTREVAAGRRPEQPRAWLHRVAANLVVNGGRHRSVVARVLGRLANHDTDEPADAPVLRAEARQELLDVLQSLSVEARTALMLAAHGFTGREIAATIGRSELATRSLMSRARMRLRDELQGRELLR
jgi:RNA polymerase sigma-70 factor (ECF subfamily)